EYTCRMDSIRDLEELLLPAEDQPVQASDSSHIRIVVIKQFRFHKAICFELYDAPLTKTGKIRNSLIHIPASDASLQAGNTLEAVRFYAAVARFQLNPVTTVRGADLRILKTIIKNPLQLKFFLHNPDFSENVSAGSLQEVRVGKQLDNFILQVRKQ